MKRFQLVILTLILPFIIVKADIVEPVKWSYNVNYISETEAELQFIATIDNHWHLYSQDIPENGPVPTSFVFTADNNYKKNGAVTEPDPIKETDPNFDMVLKYFANKAVFTQKIEIKNDNAFVIKGELEFMCCDETQCLPPEVYMFEFKIVAKDKRVATKPTPEEKIQSEKKNDEINTTEKEQTKDTLKIDTTANTDTTHTVLPEDTVQKNTEKLQSNEAKEQKEKKKNKNLWLIFYLGFLGGLLALITPCVWPMIPMTVSFFLKQSTSKKAGIRKAIIYGLSIIVIYDILGLGVTLIFGADAMNSLSTDPYFNLFFFAILVVFAIAFFGAFELTLPTKWVNYFDTKADKSGGLLGIFFMAFVLALVSFSCTGPIVGTLLVEAVTEGTTAPLVGMTGFGLALAIPFTLFAIFPSWLQSMPKSGGWLNSVKVVLGFLELALAFKFLSIADLVMHWGILDREVFLVFWIVIFALLGFYLLGKLKFAHDSDLKYVSVPRLFFAIISFAFTIYLIPGLWGAKLPAISAFSPPIHTQEFNLNDQEFDNHFDDYELGMAYAKRMNKPVLLDFTGWGCVNCREMEVSVWTNPKIWEIINENYVLISLYVDDKTPLPKEEQKEVKLGSRTKTLRTIGNKWSYLQASKYNTNSQPFYVLLDYDGKQLIPETRAYDLDINEYKKYLEKGLEAFKAKQE